jgi:hypothetical protein
MTIKRIKDEIAEMEQLYGHERAGAGPDADDLKALADSHTALLEAAKRLREFFGLDKFNLGDEGLDRVASILRNAIQQAEQAEGEG